MKRNVYFLTQANKRAAEGYIDKPLSKTLMALLGSHVACAMNLQGNYVNNSLVLHQKKAGEVKTVRTAVVM